MRRPAGGDSRGPGREWKERAVRKLQISAEYLDLPFTAPFAFDHELGADRKPTGKTA